MTWATERLDLLKLGTTDVPRIVETLRLGLLDDWGEGWVRKSWSPTPELATADGSLFGGYIAALADQVLSFAAMTVMPDEVFHRTINLQVNFLRVGRQGPLQIEAKVVAKTRQMITARAEFRREDGELLAEAVAQQLLLAPDHWPAEREAVDRYRQG